MENYTLGEEDFDVVEVDEGDPDEDDDNQFVENPGGGSGADEQAAIDNFIKSLTIKDFKKQAQFAEEAVKIISRTKSYSEAESALLSAFNKFRPKEMEKELGRSMFATEAVGRGGDA